MSEWPNEDYLAFEDRPVRVDWWWTEAGRSAHDAEVRASALREAGTLVRGHVFGRVQAAEVADFLDRRADHLAAPVRPEAGA